MQCILVVPDTYSCPLSPPTSCQCTPFPTSLSSYSPLSLIHAPTCTSVNPLGIGQSTCIYPSKENDSPSPRSRQLQPCHVQRTAFYGMSPRPLHHPAALLGQSLSLSSKGGCRRPLCVSALTVANAQQLNSYGSALITSHCNKKLFWPRSGAAQIFRRWLGNMPIQQNHISKFFPWTCDFPQGFVCVFSCILSCFMSTWCRHKLERREPQLGKCLHMNRLQTSLWDIF